MNIVYVYTDSRSISWNSRLIYRPSQTVGMLVGSAGESVEMPETAETELLRERGIGRYYSWTEWLQYAC
jgi:hypothetical protein